MRVNRSSAFLSQQEGTWVQEHSLAPTVSFVNNCAQGKLLGEGEEEREERSSFIEIPRLEEKLEPPILTISPGCDTAYTGQTGHTRGSLLS